MVDSMKNSPHNGPGTPREDMPPVSGAPGDMSGFNMTPYPDNPVNVSMAATGSGGSREPPGLGQSGSPGGLT